ncbi:MAG: hypothetical protein WA747_01810 [Steroidobacteraceae bacterium]
MHDDTVMTSWKRLTDWVKGLWGEHAKHAGAKTSGAALGHEACGTIAVEKPPTVPATMPHADREEDRQAAPLAAWEDEGGRTLRSAQAPLRKV